MSMNPELKRNLWLELTPHRLAGMPLVLFAIFFLAASLDKTEAAKAISGVSVVLFIALVVLWGTRQAAESVNEEVRDHTWDGQRMSSIGPWDMTWGKLLGSTVFPWYGGAICLVAYVLSSMVAVERNPVETALMMTLAGLFGQSVAMLASLQAVRKDRKYNKSNAAGIFILGVGLTWPIISFALNASVMFKWYGIEFESLSFTTMSLAVFLAWAVTGVYRLMRTELQMKNGPYVWLAFVCFVSMYVAGFGWADNEGHELFNMTTLAASTATLAVYLMAFSERKDPVSFRRLVIAYGRRDWHRTLQELPCWAVALPVVAAASVCVMLTSGPQAMDGVPQTSFSMLVLASMLFVVRDLSLILYFNFAKNPKRADMLMALCLFLFYGILPGIMSGMDIDVLAALFWPRGDSLAFLSVAAAFAEAAVAGSLVLKRWQGIYGTA
ncbi:MAG: hypothetical protein HZC51_10795 [Nitrospirae bacterium]|nr:hypothetical protein [Nitrospirota bacterium]